MIDTNVEQIYPFSIIARWISRHKRRKIHLSTVHRWATKGRNGVVIEWLQVGGTRCTSREAVQRFYEQLTLVAQGKMGGGPGVTAAAVRTTAQRRKAVEAANRKLDGMGV